MKPQNVSGSLRILILTPYGKDAAHISKVLGAESHDCYVCKSVTDLIENLDNGGVVLTTEEVLNSELAIPFADALRANPEWSSIPLLVFYTGTPTSTASQKKAEHPLLDFADITFLQRPISAQGLLGATKAALKDRQRQYQILHLVEQLNQDIVKKEKLERELIQAKETSDRDRAAAIYASSTKSQFLANMSHEIRTPLGAIIGFLDLLKSPSNTPEDIENYISVIDRNSIQLLRLIDDILDLSKVEAGKLDVENIEFSLPEIINDCASLMGFKASEKGIVFELQLLTPLPEKVFSDPGRLRQIIINIVGNALKFTDRGRVDLLIGFKSNELTISVRDTGIGISSEQQQNLFKAFSQADSSTTRNFGGTGLGLVLTRYLAEALGGSFDLEKSRPGEGSIFTAKVKVSTSPSVRMLEQNNFEASRVATREAERRLLEGTRILLVEDSPDNQALLKIILTKLGAEIHIAPDGNKGIELALSRPFDVVLMDIQMPGMDGHSAARKLRSTGYSVPIIALTAHAMKEEEQRTRESGFSGFLSKPIQKALLTTEILNQIRH